MTSLSSQGSEASGIPQAFEALSSAADSGALDSVAGTAGAVATGDLAAAAASGEAAAPDASLAGAPAATSPASVAGEAGSSQPAASTGLVDPQWIDRAADVLEQIKAELRPGAQRLRIDLDPPELGHLVVRMAMRDGQVMAVVQAESAATLELLERQAPELHAALREVSGEDGELSLELASRDPRAGRDSREQPPAKAANLASNDAVGPNEHAPRAAARSVSHPASDGVDTLA